MTMTISEKARDQMWQILHNHKKEDEWATIVLAILDIPELAVVDREAELPNNPFKERLKTKDKGTTTEWLSAGVDCGFELAQQAGWVKEVKDEASNTA